MVEDFPDGWALAALRHMERIDFRCEGCGKPCRRPCEPVVPGTSMRVLAVDGDRVNQQPTNLIALCAACRTPAAQKRLRKARMTTP